MRAWAIWRCRKALVVSLMILYMTIIAAVLIESIIDVIRPSCWQQSNGHPTCHIGSDENSLLNQLMNISTFADSKSAFVGSEACTLMQ